MNKIIFLAAFICLQLQTNFAPAQNVNKTAVEISSEAKNDLNRETKLEGTAWYGQGLDAEDSFDSVLTFKPKGKAVYVLSEYGRKDITFYGTYKQTGSSFVISFTGKSRWEIEGTIEGENLKCNRLFKNSIARENIFKKTRS